MIEPLAQSRVVHMEAPLPPVWVRRGPTKPDSKEVMGQSIIRVGPDGALRRALVETIDLASEVLLVASFLFSDKMLADALIAAAKRGVRVYVLTASEARLAKVIDEDDEFGARMLKDHKELLNRLADHVLLRSAEHLHAKFLVADPASSPTAWISTANFNLALRKSIELGVRLTSDEAYKLAAWFSWVFWLEAERELVEKGRLAKVKPPPATPRRPKSGPVVATAADEAGLKRAVLELIRSARRKLTVASYGLDADHEAVQALVERASAGIEVTVLTRPRPAVLEAAQMLTAAGATVLAHDKLHAKAIVADHRGLVMTANLQAHGLDAGFEVGVELRGAEAADLEWALNDWTRRFPWRFASSLERGDHLGEVSIAEEGLRTGRRTIERERSVSLPDVVASSALELGSAGEPELNAPAERDTFFQRVRFEWSVVPPRLPKKAKELKRTVVQTKLTKDGEEEEVKVQVPYEPPAYSHKGQKFIVVQSTDDQAKVARLAHDLGAKVVVP